MPGEVKISRKFVIAILLVAIYFIGVFYRLDYTKNYKREFFTTESALRFFYAKLISEGKGLPAIDYKAEYPQGLRVSLEYPVFMEYTTGYLYQWLHFNIPFTDFASMLMVIVFCFSIYAVYLVVVELTKSSQAGLLSALYYAVSFSAIIRSSGLEFLHETFALPLLFFHIYFFIKALNDEKIYYALFSGGFLFLALGTWHISQFYFALYVIFVALNFIFNRDDPRLYKSFALTLIFVILAGLTVPFLRASLFLCSQPLIIAYSFLLTYFLKGYPSKIKTRPLLFFFFSLAVLNLILPKANNQSHAYQLLFYKILFLGHKPSNPLLLPFKARAYWVGPYVSPSIYEAMLYFFPLLLFGFALIISYFVVSQRRKPDTVVLFIIYNFFVFFFLFLLISRLEVFLIFFLVILVAYLLVYIKRHIPKYYKIALAVMFFCLIVELSKGHAGKGPFTKTLQAIGLRETAQDFSMLILSKQYQGLLDWINKNTEVNAVILAHYPVSSVIRAYADRAVNLNSLVESRRSWNKIEEFLFALFNTEDKFYHFCQKYGCDYFVYTIDTIMDASPYSWRYITNSMSLQEDAAAYKMHFFPERLNKFLLVYENDYCRVYQVIKNNTGKLARKNFPVHPLVYRYGLFKQFSGSTLEFKRFIEQVYLFYVQGHANLESGNYQKAAEIFGQIQKILPDFPPVYASLGRLFEKQGHYQKASEYYKKYIDFETEGEFSDGIRRRIRDFEH